MKVIMILPPQLSIPGFVAGLLSPKTFSVFLDTQAEVVDLNMHRYLVEHQVPGREGGILQDLGSASSVISLRGKWIYENAPQRDIMNIFPTLGVVPNVGWNWMRLELMKIVYRLKFPIFLACDLITTAVMVEDFKFRYVGGEPNAYQYSMTLKEFSPVLTVIGSLGMGLIQTIIPQDGLGY